MPAPFFALHVKPPLPAFDLLAHLVDILELDVLSPPLAVLIPEPEVIRAV